MSLKKKVQYLTFKQRNEVLRDISAGVSRNAILEKYNIKKTTYYQIRKNKIDLNAIKTENTKFYNKRSKFRKSRNASVEEAVIRWFRERRDRGDPISGPILKEKARIFNEMLNGPASFMASNGWLDKFKLRHNIIVMGEKLSNDTEASKNFSAFLTNKVKDENLNLHNIYNADESGIYWRLLQNSTSACNEKDISERKDSKERVTALFCSNATGSHQIPLLIIDKAKVPTSLDELMNRHQQKHTINNLEKLGILYSDSKKGWMNKHIFLEWYKEEFIPRVLENQKKLGISGKVFLLLDNSPTHPLEEELNSIHDNFEVIYLPLNVPAFIQPLNKGIIALTKKLYKKHLLKSLLNEEKAINSSECVNSLNFKNSFGLLSKAWGEVQETTLRNVWKPIFGDELITNFTTNQENQILTNQENVDELQYEIDITSELSNVINPTANMASSFSEEIREALCQWFEKDEQDCGWEASSDEDIVNFVTKKKMPEEVSRVEEEKIVDESSQQEPVSAKEAYECLLKFKSWLQNQPKHLLLFTSLFGVKKEVM